jgi:hypothetical protein
MKPARRLTKNSARTFFLVLAGSILCYVCVLAADQTDEKVADIIGIIKGQTARLNLVNVGVVSEIPPGPRKASLIFSDVFGNPLDAMEDVSLSSGEATFLDLNADRQNFRGRFLVKSMVRFAPHDPALSDPCANTHLTLEIFNNKTLETKVFAPEPHLADPPEPEKHFGMFGLTFNQNVELNVMNLGDGSVTPDPCVASLAFIDSNGRELLQPVNVSLNPGGGFGLAEFSNHAIIINDKVGRIEIRGEVRFAPLRDPSAPNPCTKVKASLEVIDAKTGQTDVFIGDPGI